MPSSPSKALLLRTSKSKLLDAVSLLPGCAGEISDAPGAYTQTDLLGTETWVILPQEFWPKSWHGKWNNPVVPLKQALRGHPNSGKYWKQYAHKSVQTVGFKPMGSEWECCF